MGQNTKFVVSLLGGAAIIACLFAAGELATRGCHEDMAALCTPGTRPPLTGWDSVDRILFYYVTSFQFTSHHVLGNHVMTILLAEFGAVLAIVAVEGSRPTSGRLLSQFILWGLLANVLSGTTSFFIFWVPAYVYLVPSKRLQHTGAWFVPASKANGILAALLIGYGVPTLCMRLVPIRTYTEEIITAIWQFAPVWIAPMYQVAGSWFACFNARLSESQEQERRSNSKRAVVRLYMVIGIINVLLYVFTCFQLWKQELFTWGVLAEFVTMPVSKPIGLSVQQRGELVMAYVFSIDLIGIYLAGIWWIVLDSGIFDAAAVIFATLFAGPGASLAFFAAYREHRVRVDVTEKKTQ